MPLIHIVSRDGKTVNYNLQKDEVTLGRNDDNDIVLADPIASRYHAKIKKEGDAHVLTDLGSHNGTKLNGTAIQTVELNHEDEIQIGKSRLTYLTREKSGITKPETLFLAAETEQDNWQQQTIKISPQKSCMGDSEELLLTVAPGKKKKGRGAVLPSKKKEEPAEVEEEVQSLERMNKVLFVLYEVSRQLNSSLDFNELLNKIMDLLFMVIEADYGCLILIEEGAEDELVPVVMKAKEEGAKEIAEMKISRTIIQKVIDEKVALLTSDAMADSRLAEAMSIVKKGIRSAMCVPLWDQERVIGAIQLNSTRMDNVFNMNDLELLNTIGCQMAMSIGKARLNKQIQEEEQLRQSLERFHSPQVIEKIVRDHQEAKDDLMEAKELMTTILFTDMVKFTPLSEQMHPREINQLLNQFFSLMTDIIFEHNGTLDKYIGDGLMAVFGAPMEKGDDAERAVQTALEIRKEMLDLMNRDETETKFDIRIGINTGKVVAGNIGSPRRLDYTVIGDPVNVASRLESIAQPNQILIGEETYKQVKEKFKINEIGPTQLKGRREEIMVYEVLD